MLHIWKKFIILKNKFNLYKIKKITIKSYIIF